MLEILVLSTCMAAAGAWFFCWLADLFPSIELATLAAVLIVALNLQGWRWICAAAPRVKGL